jgi:hypothetical protein
MAPLGLGEYFGRMGLYTLGGIVPGVTGAVSGLIFSENWDGVTAPALPANWTASATGITSTTNSTSGVNSFEAQIISTAYTTATFNTVDPNNGDVVVETKVLFSGTANVPQLAGVLARGTGITYGNTTTGHGNSYHGGIFYQGAPHAVQIQKSIGGTLTVLATLATTAFQQNVWYRIFLKCVGTSLSLKVRQENNGAWLNASGVFVFTEQACLSVTDSAVTGAGLTGTWTYTNGAGAGIIYLDDFAVYNATATQAPATALRVSPSAAALLSGYANHRGGAVSIFADGSAASPLTVPLSDGGAGGAFFSGISSFTPITSVTLPTNTDFANALVFYRPAYAAVSATTLSTGGALSATPSSLSQGITAYPTTASPTITGLSFDQTAIQVPTSLWANLPQDISGGFVAGLAGYSAINNVGSAGAVETVVSGVYRRANASLDNTIWYKSTTALLNPGYNVELQVNAWGGGLSDQAIAGVAQDSSNYVAVLADNHAGTAALVKFVGGVGTTIATATVSLPVGSKILFQVAKEWAAAWYKRPADTAYQFIGCGGLAASFNWSLAATLALTFPFWGTSQTAGTSVGVTNFACGHAGGMGLQNPRFIKDITTGAPILSLDKSSVYITGNAGMITNNLLTNGFIDSAWTIDVWLCNTQTFAMTNISRIWFTRNSEVVADLPVAIGYNPGDGSFTLLSSNWPDYQSNGGTTDVYYATTSSNIFAGGVFYLANTAVKLPNSVAAGAGSPLSHYDPDLILNGTTLYVSYAETNLRSAWNNFYPCLAHSTTGITGTFTQDFANTTTTNHEGTVIAQVGGTQYVLSEGPSTIVATNFAGTVIGTLSNVTVGGAGAGFVNAASGIGSHPCLVAIPGETVGQTRYQIWGFDNTPFDPGNIGVKWNWGTACVFESTQRYTAAEYVWITR